MALDAQLIRAFPEYPLLVERVLNALTNRNSFTVFKAGNRTVMMARYVPRPLEVDRIKAYRDTFPVLPIPEGEWPVSR